jgi:hypothetical protein
MPHEDGIASIGFSGDSSILMTAGKDGGVKLWKMGDAVDKPAATLATDEDAQAIVAAAVEPAGPGAAGLPRVAIAREDGTYEIWTPGQNRPRVLERDRTRRIRTVAFLAGGKYLASAGDDRRIDLRAVTDLGRVLPLRRPSFPLPAHNEAITALVPWGDRPILATASLDTTVRLWDLEQRTLLGTLAAMPGSTEWAVYTPDGHFDASLEGEARMTRVARNGQDVLRLEQFRPDGPKAGGDTGAYRFGLAGLLSDGKAPGPIAEPRAAQPRLVMDTAAPHDPRRRGVRLVVDLGASPVQDVRLYHNGRAIVPESIDPATGRFEVEVQLIKGKNRLYAMASKPEALDGRSNVLELECERETPGRAHVLAMGVSEYRRGGLRYADADARRFAGFLTSNTLGPAGPKAHLLENAQVTPREVEKRFEAIRQQVRQRPEDTVVVFLAGHGDVRDDQFCLMLSGAEMPGPTDRLLVSTRGAKDGGEVKAGPNDVLRYATIHRELRNLNALNRLVVVDACEAGAILDETGVETMRRKVEEDSHVSRTTYLFAARRGELAGETSALEHGLLTYTLLRGLGDRNLKPASGVSIFEQYPNADFPRDGESQGDGEVDADELQRFSELVLPELAGRFGEFLTRGADAVDESADRAHRYQDRATAGGGFPLVRVARP